jgi:hypothetical protein
MKQYKEHYIVYENGKIWSNKSNKYLKQTKGKNGYVQVGYGTLHRILAECFISNPENKRCVNHKDGNKENNNLNNLEWVTDSENQLHSYRKLGRKINYNFNNTKLTKEDVEQIRNSNISLTKLAIKYNCSIANIHKVKTYKTW